MFFFFSVDYTEFIAASIDHKLYEQEAICRAAFRVFDLDGDGKITMLVCCLQTTFAYALIFFFLFVREEMKKVLEMNFVQEVFTSEMIEDMVKEVLCLILKHYHTYCGTAVVVSVVDICNASSALLHVSSVLSGRHK